MPRIDVPGMEGGVELGVEEPSIDAKAIIANQGRALHAIYQQLLSLNNQMDVLLRLTSGAISRKELVRRFKEFDAARADQPVGNPDDSEVQS